MSTTRPIAAALAIAAQTITLDNPGGRFSITRFTKTSECPS